MRLEGRVNPSEQSEHSLDCLLAHAHALVLTHADPNSAHCLSRKDRTTLFGMEYQVEGMVCAVTGAAGFVGHRLVEMLLEVGAASVIAIDVAEPAEWTKGNPRLKYSKVDITRADEVSEALRGADCVWHVAALVGPYHSPDLYMKVSTTVAGHERHAGEEGEDDLNKIKRGRR